MTSAPAAISPEVPRETLLELESRMNPEASQALAKTIELWSDIKQKGGRVVVATGSGPNIHEGVTTLLAELVTKGLVDGILTSSAVVGHEMSGSLERVRRVEGTRVGFPAEILPLDGKVEAALLSPDEMAELGRDIAIDQDLYRRLLAAPGNEIFKVAGNLAYPTGLWIENVARKLEKTARQFDQPLEAVAGLGADPRTMLGACARRGVPCLVTVPQLVGSGQVGLSLGDSVSITRRSSQIARMLGQADLIIESGVALTQEIHDGPFELFTGHGFWAREMGHPTFSLSGKSLVRIDLDPTLKRVWDLERGNGDVGRAIDQGRPKAASMGVPFRMEMSGFARLPGSLPMVADLGVAWPLLATGVSRRLGVELEFMSCKQDTPAGEAVRRFIVDNVKRLDPAKAIQAAQEIKQWP